MSETKSTDRPRRHPEGYLGRQPAADLLMQRGVTVRIAAAKLGVDKDQLLRALVGVTPPTREIALGLMDLFDRPPDELFTPRSLRKALARDRHQSRGAS